MTVLKPSAALATSSRLGGLDILRVLAMAMIFIQHAMAVQGRYADTTWHGINLGQLGVGIFCAISGYLAVLGSARPPLAWLRRRLITVFPTYWLVTVLAFLLAFAVGNDTLSWPLFISQMLGTGYFTHGWELINVVSWFISLILLCYLIAFCGRVLGKPAIVLLATAVVCMFLVATRTEVDLGRHIVSFCLAGALTLVVHRRGSAMFAVGVILTVVGISLDTQFFYAGAALLSLAISLRSSGSGPLWLRTASDYSYEFFLIHGIALVAVIKIGVLTPLQQVSLAFAASLVFAPLLRRGTAIFMAPTRPT